MKICLNLRFPSYLCAQPFLPFSNFQMDTIVNPLKSASKTMGNAVKSVPDGMSKIGDGLGKVFTSQKQVLEVL